MAVTWPGYLRLHECGELARRAEEAVEALASRYSAISRPLAPREFRQAVDLAQEQGLRLARD